ncbi:MAG: RDD family protein [Phycisphaeraceae bacterium]|nr:RDD family protein [Phycisphaeraceae bacterium]
MRPCKHLIPIRWLAVLGLGLICAAMQAAAGDLPAASDGAHLWLIQQATPPADDKDAEPKLTLYHLPTDIDRHLATKLDPVQGELMPRGIAAGDGRLLIVTNDRQVMTIRPVWSELLQGWEYRRRTLTALPEGCTLIALAMGGRGPWALVQVRSRGLLERLDARQQQRAGPTDQQILNKALGLPEDLQWDEPTQTDPLVVAPGDDGTAAPQDDTTEEATPQETDAAAAEPTLPVYRLIKLRSSKWVSSPLPEGFDVPREAALLVRPGDDRPTVLVDSNSDFRRTPILVRYNPIDPVETPTGSAAEPTEAQAPAWARLITGMQLRSGRQWSASLVNGQIVVALERFRPQKNVTIDTFLLRGENAYEIGYSNITVGDNARWALCPWQNDIGLLASPAPPPDPSVDQSNRLPTLALLVGLSMDGQPMFVNEQGQTLMMPISEERPTILDGNADLFVQILAFITAIFMMVMFYRRAPQQDQLDLPDHLVLASFSRRAIAGMIDLAPGFILAGLIYGVTVSETLVESWPGNGIEKAFSAMRPGFVVILVTLFHTTVCEFILARSLGKILMGMYVADLNGKPAPPMPCLGRALSRAFELFAPLMILVAVISPARQRLGDILAKTTVVMRKPEPPPEPEDNDGY